MESKSLSLTAYVGRRTLAAIPLLAGVLMLTFVLIHVVPGDPVTILAGEHTTPEHQAFIRQQFGLDRPLLQRFWFYVTRAVRGDLGFSYASGRPVIAEIGARLPPTVLPVGSALGFSAIGGVALGAVAARRLAAPVDVVASVGCIVFHAIPVFLLGQLLLLSLALAVDMFPVQGMTSIRQELGGLRYLVDVLHHLALLTIILGMHHAALSARVTRASMIEVLGEDFIRTARAKGLSDARILGKHALRNALVPVITVLGSQLGGLFAGAVLTETVFGWPGLGRLLPDAALARDYPLLLGMFLLICTGIVVANLLADLACAYVDPRIKYR